MKSSLGYPAMKHDREEGQGRLQYICCKNVLCNQCSVVFIVFLFHHVPQQGSLGCFSSPPYFRTFTGPSLHEFNFYVNEQNFTPTFLPFLCASCTELCHVKIGNTAVTTKWQGWSCTGNSITLLAEAIGNVYTRLRLSFNGTPSFCMYTSPNYLGHNLFMCPYTCLMYNYSGLSTSQKFTPREGTWWTILRRRSGKVVFTGS